VGLFGAEFLKIGKAPLVEVARLDGSHDGAARISIVIAIAKATESGYSPGANVGPPRRIQSNLPSHVEMNDLAGWQSEIGSIAQPFRQSWCCFKNPRLADQCCVSVPAAHYSCHSSASWFSLRILRALCGFT
jgi:hypothetical protein